MYRLSRQRPTATRREGGGGRGKTDAGADVIRPYEPQSDEPQSDEPLSDKPQRDEPQNDKPQNDEPQNDEPQM
jgi:hypothetical protein